MRLRAALPTALVAGATALTLGACSGGAAAPGDAARNGPGGDGPTVQAALYPLAWAAEQVAGADAVVETLATPGVEPHDVELTPRQVGALEEAALVLTIPGLQPSVDDALESISGADVLDATAVADVAETRAGGVPPAPDPTDLGLTPDLQVALADGGTTGGAGGPDDPHVWLDPVALAAVGDATAERLAAVDPAHAAGYRERAVALRADLEVLDAELAAGLASCESRVMVVSHEAFGHLARRYGLLQVGVAGLSPEDEPSARRLDTVADVVRQLGATTVFTEPGVDAGPADTVAAESGATTAELDPVELEPPDGDYPSALRADLAELRDALGCS